MRILFAVAAISIIAAPAHSVTIRVPADYPTIQAGIDAAAPGDLVLVAPGTYTGASNKNLDFHGKAIEVRSEAGAMVTIIDCQNDGRGFQFQTGEPASARVSGFTITRGRAPGGYPHGYGGGMICAASSPTIEGCTFIENAAPSAAGGGLFCYQSAPTIAGCRFQSNTAHSGGGIYLEIASPTITNCTFSGNASVANGGGLSCGGYAAPSVSGCTFSGNSTLINGGGLSCEWYSAPLARRDRHDQELHALRQCESGHRGGHLALVG